MPITRSSCLITAILLLVILAGSKLWAQGPPYQTDDPVPVDLHHYEFYIFGAADGTPVEMDSAGPAFEFNWGALPRLQLHAILPFGVAAPLNNPVYLPSGTGPTEFGLTDMELGSKIAFVKENKHLPQIGTFTMLEVPTGNADKGLGVGRVWYKLPIWLQKNVGKWTFDGGRYTGLLSGAATRQDRMQLQARQCAPVELECRTRGVHFHGGRRRTPTGRCLGLPFSLRVRRFRLKAVVNSCPDKQILSP
ncbi:MAG TPA: hypothetical protein VKP13_11665 [Nitrospira sp.]|nr:hypothetical protein [Nitrospira sp.]